MELNSLCNTFRPVLLEYFKTKRTLLDANEAIQKYSNLDIDKDFLNLFSIMSTEVHTPFSKELKEIARKLTIGILRYPKSCSSETYPKSCSSETYEQINFDLQETITKYKTEASKITIAHRINQICESMEHRYWSRFLEDIKIGYYDEILKLLIGIRSNLLESLDGSGYSKEAVMENMDIEYIRLQLEQKSYGFIGLFEFIIDFIESRLHPVLKPKFIEKYSYFIETIEGVEKARSIVLCTQFIVNEAIEFLYLDVEEHTIL